MVNIKEVIIMQKTLKENKMGTQKVPKLLFSLAIPIIISMLVQALYNIVDSIFVSWFDENAGTAALTAAFPIQNLIIAVSVGLAVGTNAILSRSLGEKNFKKVDEVAGQGIFLTLCGYVLFLIFGIFLVDLYVGTQATVGSLHYQYSKDYLSVVCVFSIGVFIQVISERLLQATGRAFLSMIIQLSGAIINIILDPILIYGLLGAPQMGVKGAAIATVIGQSVAAVLGIFLNLKYNPDIKIKLKNLLPKPALLKEMLAIGIPSVFMQAIGSVMTFSMNKILIGFGQEPYNVFGVYFKLQSFIFMPIFGLTNGMVPIIAYNYGALKPKRVYEARRVGFICAIAYMIVGLTLFQTIPDTLLGFFNASDAMLTAGRPALRTISWSFLFAGVSIISISTCQAFGKSFYSLIVSVARQLGVLVPVAYLLSLSGKVELIWWAFPIAETLALVLSVVFAKIVMKKAFDGKVLADDNEN